MVQLGMAALGKALTGGMTCAGQLSPLALPQDTNQPVVQAPALKTKPDAAAVPKEDWSTACFSSFRDSGSSFSLPASSWQLPPGCDGAFPLCLLEDMLCDWLQWMLW